MIKKLKGIFIFLIGLFFINSVNAYGYYLPYPLQNLFYYLDPYNLTLLTIFFIVLAGVHFSIMRMGIFKDNHGEPNTATSGIISFLLALTTVRWIMWRGFDIEYYIYSLQYSGLLWIIIPIVIIGIIYLFIKAGKKRHWKRPRTI